MNQNHHHQLKNHNYTYQTKEKDTTIQRVEFHNQFYIAPTEQDTLEVPYVTSDSLTKQLLEILTLCRILFADPIKQNLPILV